MLLGKGVDKEVIVVKAAGFGGFLQGMSREEHLCGVLHPYLHVILLYRNAKVLFEKQIDVMVALSKGFFVILGAQEATGVFLDKICKRIHGKALMCQGLGIALTSKAQDHQKSLELLRKEFGIGVGCQGVGAKVAQMGKTIKIGGQIAVGGKDYAIGVYTDGRGTTLSLGIKMNVECRVIVVFHWLLIGVGREQKELMRSHAKGLMIGVQRALSFFHQYQNPVVNTLPFGMAIGIAYLPQGVDLDVGVYFKPSFDHIHSTVLNIQLGRNIDLIRDVFPILFSLSDAFGEQIFDLTVHRAKIILCPGGNGGVELGGEAQRKLLFLIIVHINTGCPS